MNTTKVEISVKTLVTVALFLLALVVIFLIRDVLILLFVAFILKSALTPLVEKIESRKIGRGYAILLVYLVLLLFLFAIFAIILPLLITQTINLTTNFPFYVSQVSTVLSSFSVQDQTYMSALTQELSTFSSNIFRITLSVFSAVISIISVAVLTFYLMLDERNLKTRLHDSLPKPYNKQTIRIITDVEKRLGAWVRGQLLLSGIIGVLYFIGLSILRIENPLALGLFAGLMEVVPFIGPVIAAIPAVIIALTISPWLALAVVALFFVVQQLEGHIIVPKVMQRATGLSPLVVLIAILVGGRLEGIIGILLGVPFAVVIQVILFDFWHIRGAENHRQARP